MRLHVGCAMWTHRAWQGRLLAHPLPSDERLRHYAGWCDAVEGNTTFYATPTRDTVASWARQTDPDFRFVLKLPKLITHERRLTDADAAIRVFLDAIEPLGPRAHALWIQLPGSFAPSDVAVLASFLRQLPRSHRYAVEVRHPAFFDEPRSAVLLEETLAAAGAEWIPFDTTAFFRAPPTSDAEREAWTRKPRMPFRSRADGPADRPISRPRRPHADHRGLAAVDRRHRRVAARGPFADDLRAHPGQRRRARARPPPPRRRTGAPTRTGGAARPDAGRAPDPVLTVVVARATPGRRRHIVPARSRRQPAAGRWRRPAAGVRSPGPPSRDPDACRACA